MALLVLVPKVAIWSDRLNHVMEIGIGKARQPTGNKAPPNKEKENRYPRQLPLLSKMKESPNSRKRIDQKDQGRKPHNPVLATRHPAFRQRLGLIG